MSSKPNSCDFTPVSFWDNSSTDVELNGSSRDFNMDLQQPIFSALNPLQNQTLSHKDVSGISVTTSDSESGIFPGESELCVVHDSDLDWFCSSEQKRICSHCAIVGSCQGHTVTPLANRVTAIRNQLVDVCEKMQLQAQRIERFINQTLTDKERSLQVEANRAREQVVAQVSVAREAMEEEEQKLLEAIQREEERVDQCLLTQRAHWGQALALLTQTRTRLVQTLTSTPDMQLATSGQEIDERIEEADGVGEPRDTDQLKLNASCSNSKLMRGLWASAILLGPNACGLAKLTIDDRTVSSLLSVSEDLCTLTFLPKRSRQSPPYNPARFDCWPNALGTLAISSGTHNWLMDVGESGAFKLGVCYASIGRKGSGNDSRLGYNAQSWVLSKYDGDFSFCHAGKNTPLRVVLKPKRIGLLVDWPSQTLVFYHPDSNAVLHSVSHAFSAPLLPAFAVADRSVTILQKPQS
ncbi:hypothetical protein DPEC_G00325180 [Dallia pectoralis]|uniref:Uncharacterized protein n=1 Tax=Dallia pectoralis TaxID=75939 RepID=A0ACC2FBG6_DALPE|nr:hypothetical protein DPEC_G00325180 [Dallia pectoralis]